MRLTHKTDRWQRAYLWILRNGPRLLAHWLADYAVNVPHNEASAWCWPCEARGRVKRDAHTYTIGPLAIEYCSKCGLEKSKWPTWCSNRVERVRNKPTPKPRHVSVGWED